MIVYIALSLSILNTVGWIVFTVGIRALFKRMYPLFKSLTETPFGAIMSEPPIIEATKKES